MKLIIYILLIFFVFKIFKYLAAPSAPSGKKVYRKADTKADTVDDVMVKDPVCEVYFPRHDGIHLNFGGKDMYFCSPECRDKFVKLNSNK
ncbi:hypothetical protein [Desulfobacterium sp. N47]|uniref:TRASH domain-containing protein n=1 Tax=uncultured Desulfobacterium sp. TaxID=201089 RepID=E1YBK4_9BACT|nr:hypothetical protein N47_G32720 [uncultured Desulfobacterium sp.]